MGVYFSTAVAYGIRLPYDPDNEEHLYPRNMPEGCEAWFGGDAMNGENQAVVVGPTESYRLLMHSERQDHELYGVFSLEELYMPQIEVGDELAWYADRHGIYSIDEADKQIGMWVISSVG